MLAEFLGLEKRAQKGPSFTAADYERLVLTDPDFSVTLTEHEALSIAAIWQAVELLSGDLAKLPLEKLRVVDGQEVRHQQHPTWRVVHDRPTPNMGAFKWWRRFYVQLLLWTNAYARINIDGLGQVISLTLLESSMVSHANDENGETGYWYLNESAEFQFLRADQVIHVEDIALHRTAITGRARDKPLRMINQARKHFNLNLMIERYGTKFFEHGGRLGGWLELPAQMTKKARDNYEKQFRDVYEQSHALFKTVVARGGVKFHADQADPEKTQMVEARKEQVRDAARWWNIPPHKLGDDTRVSFNSLEQENKSYLDSTLSPRLLAVQDEAKCKLLRPHERESGRHLFRHNVSDLIQVDTATAADVAVKLFNASLITKNEGRRRVGDQPVDNGDDFLETPIGGVPPRGDSPPPTPEPEPEDEEEEEDNLRFVRLPLLESIQRCLESMDRTCQRKAKQLTPTGFANWLDGTSPASTLEKDCRQPVHKILAVSVEAYAGAAGIDPTLLETRLFAACCAEIRAKIRKNNRLTAKSRSLLLLERIENADPTTGREPAGIC